MIRRITLLGAAVLGIATVLPAAPAQAIPPCRNGYTCLYQWWSDPDHTIFNGYLSVDCQGVTQTSGTRTGFLEFNQVMCG